MEKTRPYSDESRRFPEEKEEGAELVAEEDAGGLVRLAGVGEGASAGLLEVVHVLGELDELVLGVGEDFNNFLVGGDGLGED